MIQRLQCVIRILKNRSHTVDNKNFEQQKGDLNKSPFCFEIYFNSFPFQRKVGTGGDNPDVLLNICLDKQTDYVVESV